MGKYVSYCKDDGVEELGAEGNEWTYEEVTRRWRKQHSEELHYWYLSQIYQSN
jgi:hypothetical protein